MVKENSVDFLPSFPPGPLDHYRKQASFDWKTMAVVMEREDILKFKVILFRP
jgi:acyl-CoA oxidase